MRNLSLATILFTLTLACGPPTHTQQPGWYSHQPIRIVVDNNVPATYKRSDILTTATERLWQFGLTIDAATTSRDVFVEASACDCKECEGFTSYVLSSDFTRIHLCPPLATLCSWVGYPRCIQMTIGHELCHVLGLVGHAGLGQGDLCSASTAEHGNVDAYSANDIDKVCAAGMVGTGACY